MLFSVFITLSNRVSWHMNFLLIDGCGTNESNTCGHEAALINPPKLNKSIRKIVNFQSIGINIIDLQPNYQ